MNKINTSGWKEFEMKSLGFYNFHGERLNKGYRVEGITPFITAGKVNRGVAQYIETTRNTYHKAITVDMFGNCFFQNEDCAGDDNVYFFVNNNISDNQKLFISASINAVTSIRFAYKEQFRQPHADALTVHLPATQSGEPDWAYIDSFMQNVMNESKACLGNLRLAKASKSSVDISTWKNFEIGSLFDIVKGTRLTKANMKPGDIRFIGSSAMNNGWTTSIKNDEHLHPANTLTVCYNGSVGETFYQDAPVWASDDVNVLYPKFKMNERIGMFIAPLIRSVGQRYAFVDKWRMEVMEHGEIKLPVDEEGIPDWAYMDLHMEAILTQSKKSMDALKEVTL